MYVTPPTPNQPRPAAGPPGWLVIGPGLAALIGLFLLTVIYRFDGHSLLQRELHLSTQSLLLSGFVGYLVAAVLALPAGLLLGGRFPTSVTVPALGLMLIGALLVAFTPNVALLLIGRVLDGFGTGAAVGATAALTRRLRSGRGATAGVTAGLGVLALVIAPFLGALISDSTSFRLMYLIGAVFVFLALIVAAVLGIVAMVSAKPKVQPMPYGMPYPPQGPPYA
ncbi:MAG TPA: MFS transporter [Amycolatopsis sp.]|jgi:MFS family permease